MLVCSALGSFLPVLWNERCVRKPESTTNLQTAQSSNRNLHHVKFEIPPAAFVECPAPTRTRLAHTEKIATVFNVGNSGKHSYPEKYDRNTVNNNWNKQKLSSSPASASNMHHHHHHQPGKTVTNSHQRVDRQHHQQHHHHHHLLPRIATSMAHVKGSITSTFPTGGYLRYLLDSKLLSGQYPRQSWVITPPPDHRSAHHKQTAWAQRGRSS